MREQWKQRLYTLFTAEEDLTHDLVQSEEGPLLPGLMQWLVLSIYEGLWLVEVAAIKSLCLSPLVRSIPQLPLRNLFSLRP